MRTDVEILDYYDTEVVKYIVSETKCDAKDALSRFLSSRTYAMLANPEMRMWQFGPLGIYEIWRCEQETGSPLNSNYLRAA